MNSLVKKAAGLGALAGLRTTIPPAVISHFKNNDPDAALAHSNLGFIQSPAAAIITKIAGMAEASADKAPGAPDRIAVAQVLPRVASGALVGAIVFQANRGNVIKGTIIGGVAALAATYASFYLRKRLKKVPFVKDSVLGLLEDMFVLNGSKLILNQQE